MPSGRNKALCFISIFLDAINKSTVNNPANAETITIKNTKNVLPSSCEALTLICFTERVKITIQLKSRNTKENTLQEARKRNNKLKLPNTKNVTEATPKLIKNLVNGCIFKKTLLTSLFVFCTCRFILKYQYIFLNYLPNMEFQYCKHS